MTAINADHSSKHFLILGAGAIGTYVGGSLLLAQQNVTFIERPEYAKDICANGLRMDLGGVTHTIKPLNVVTSIKEALIEKHFDILILALKSYDTVDFVHEVIRENINLPPILCLQNGVENEDEYAKVMGKKSILYGSVTSAIERLGIGSIKLQRLRGIGISGDNPLAKMILPIFQSAKLNAHYYADPLSMKWSKMLTNLLANASSAILQKAPKEIYKDADLFKVEIRQILEALQVMKKLGLHVVDLPGTPVRALALALSYFSVTLNQIIIGRTLGSGRGGKLPSLYLDLISCKGYSEVEYLNGAVARFGDRLGVPTPVNHVFNEILNEMTKKSLVGQVKSLNKEELLQMINDREHKA